MSKHPALAGIPLVLGGNVFGWTADRDASFEVLDAYFENGGRMIDTAECYSFWVPGHKGGESESVIGEWLTARGVRSQMRIATKTNVENAPGGLKPERLKAQLAASLERLQTDYVDLYYAHRDDAETPQAEVAEGFAGLIAAGTVRAAGASNFTAERFIGALAAARKLGVPGYSVLQNHYNLLERDGYSPALRVLCREHDIELLPYAGLAGGYLTGKYRKPADFDRYSRGNDMRKYAEKGAQLLPVLDKIAADCEATLGQVALAWLFAQPGITAPIVSATTADQVDDVVEALELELTAKQLVLLDTAVA